MSSALITDSRSNLPPAIVSKFPMAFVKSADIVWNDMPIAEPSDALTRQLFQQHAEINPKTSGFTFREIDPWSDFVVDKALTHSTLWLVHAGSQLFAKEHGHLLNATIMLKTHYADLFKKHNKTSGHCKLATIDSGTWFGGVGIATWQIAAYLNKVGDSSKFSFTQLRGNLLQLAARSRTITVVNNQQVNPDIASMVGKGKLLDSVKKTILKEHWCLLEAKHNRLVRTPMDNFNQALSGGIDSIIQLAKKGTLAFPGIIISCSQKQRAALSKNPSFLKLKTMEQSHKLKLVINEISISECILLGVDSIHFSYAEKE